MAKLYVCGGSQRKDIARRYSASKSACTPHYSAHSARLLTCRLQVPQPVPTSPVKQPSPSNTSATISPVSTPHRSPTGPTAPGDQPHHGPLAGKLNDTMPNQEHNSPQSAPLSENPPTRGEQASPQVQQPRSPVKQPIPSNTSATASPVSTSHRSPTVPATPVNQALHGPPAGKMNDTTPNQESTPAQRPNTPQSTPLSESPPTRGEQAPQAQQPQYPSWLRRTWKQVTGW